MNFPGSHHNQSHGSSQANTCCLTITDQSTPDPYATYHNGKFHMTWTAGDRVEIWTSTDILTLGRSCSRQTIWRPPPNTPYSADIWAPELHDLAGRWYVYVACADPKVGNASHRMYVLGGPPSTQDPCEGGERGWEFLGPVRGLPDQWAIDGTAVILHNELFFSWSGWPAGARDEKTQEIFIVKMANPVEACSQATCLCRPTEHWERSGESGINEGPQFLYSPDNSWVGLAYSCAGSWTRDYKMNTLRYTGGDPLHPSSWQKSPRPFIQSASRPPFGPGHASFLTIGNETWCCYHATDRETDGWENRKARLQRVNWTADGPDMGSTTGNLVPDPATFLAARPTADAALQQQYGGMQQQQQGGMQQPQQQPQHQDTVGKLLGKFKDKMRNF